MLAMHVMPTALICHCHLVLLQADIAAALAAAVAPTGAAAADGLEASIALLAKQAMSADPEAAARMERYQAAVVRLEKARAAEKELESIMEVRAAAAAAGVGRGNCWLLWVRTLGAGRATAG
jgi:hypothetical protein